MKFLIVITTLFSIFCVMNQAIAQPVKICSDQEDWAPFTFYPRVNGKADKSRQIGITQDLLKEVFKIVGLKYSVTPQPWKRCLQEVHKFGKKKNLKCSLMVVSAWKKSKSIICQCLSIQRITDSSIQRKNFLMDYHSRNLRI